MRSLTKTKNNRAFLKGFFSLFSGRNILDYYPLQNDYKFNDTTTKKYEEQIVNYDMEIAKCLKLVNPLYYNGVGKSIEERTAEDIYSDFNAVAQDMNLAIEQYGK